MNQMLRVLSIGLLIVSTFVGATGQAKERWKVDKDYDQKTDKTSVDLRMMPVTCVKEGCVFFNLRATFSGKRPVALVDRFVFGLYFFTKDPQAMTDPDLRFNMDAEVLETGPMTYVGKDEKDGLIGHAYGIPLTNSEIGKIANAKKVGIQIGSVNLMLAEHHIAAIADLYKQVSLQ